MGQKYVTISLLWSSNYCGFTIRCLFIFLKLTRFVELQCVISDSSRIISNSKGYYMAERFSFYNVLQSFVLLCFYNEDQFTGSDKKSIPVCWELDTPPFRGTSSSWRRVMWPMTLRDKLSIQIYIWATTVLWVQYLEVCLLKLIIAILFFRTRLISTLEDSLHITYIFFFDHHKINMSQQPIRYVVLKYLIINFLPAIKIELGCECAIWEFY